MANRRATHHSTADDANALDWFAPFDVSEEALTVKVSDRTLWREPIALLQPALI